MKKSLFDFLNKKWFDVSVAFMSMHLGFSCVQKAFKRCLGAHQKLLRIFRLFLEFILTFPSYFYLLECSKIFILISKYLIWVPHIPNHL
jgi:hypothetical protein